MRRCQGCRLAKCFRRTNAHQRQVRLEASSGAGEMWFAPSQSIASAEQGTPAFPKAGKHLINLPFPVAFHFTVLCNPAALPSACPSDAVSHPLGGRGALGEIPQSCNLTLILTPPYGSPPPGGWQGSFLHTGACGHFLPGPFCFLGSSLIFPSASLERSLHLLSLAVSCPWGGFLG